MNSEKTFSDRLQRANELHIAVSSFSLPYQPVDAGFSLAALDAAIRKAREANSAVDAARMPYQDQVVDRVALVKSISPLITQSLAYVKSNSAWAKRFEAIKLLADKVRGISPSRAKVANPLPEKKARNSGERSFVEIAAHLKRYIARLEDLSGYLPQDEKISILRLTELFTNLDGLNQSVPTLAQILADAIADRQESYSGTSGLKSCFDGVKISVKGQYGQNSSNYKSISGMRW